MGLPRFPAPLGVIVVAILALAAFGPSGCAIEGARPASAEPTVKVTERDFHLSGPGRLQSGAVTLSVTNRGPVEHELIVVRKHGRTLPLRSDGLTINEDRIASDEVGALEPGEPGVRQLTVHLAPGTYEMFCNMAGHFMAGMHHTFTVG
jgi:uncharacterized cupredoxin-like copper-binding protein